MNLSEINPGLVRKYLYEYVLIALVACVVYLFLVVNSLNEYNRDISTKREVELIRTVDANTNALNAFLNYQKRKEWSGQKNETFF